MTIANAEMAAAWDGDEGAHWAAHADRYEAASRGYWDALVGVLAIRPHHTIVDIGCGTGRSTRDLARMVPSGSVLGVDLSAKMLERARAVADAEGLANVTFEQVDAQVHPFPAAAFDLAISAFGAMFFADPTAAFTNIRRALRPDGGLALLAWGELADNEWVAAIRKALSAGRDLPLPAPGAPGPFSMADPDRTARVLSEAGFVDLQFAEINEPIRLGEDADDAFSFASTFGITRGLTHDLDDAARAAALAALHATFVAHETDGGVLFRGSAWLVTARAGAA